MGVAIVLGQLVASPSGGSETCTRETGVVSVLGQDFYLDDRRAKGDGYWVYWENGEKPGYQRGGSFLFFSDPCARPHSDRAILHVP